MKPVKAGLRWFFVRLEAGLEALFGPRLNPLVQLGTLGWFLFWIITASGIYVYVFFDTGVTQAWESLDRLSRDQWYLGGLMRSLHRYASDALVVVVVVHLLREFAMDRMRGNRWFPWVTGVPLLWFMYACGITGYWLVWDELAQFVAVATTEWLDSIGIFAEPIARNFLDSERLSGRFFTLMVYMHIALPLLMLLFMWVHIQRHAHARVNPPRALAIGTLAALVALSFAWPAVSQPPADLDRVPFRLGFDWFYLGVYPLLDWLDGAKLWLLLVGGSVLMTLLPWAPPLRKAPPARVDLANCNGCARCFADCPFGAITMMRRSDGLAFEQEAQVDPGMCMSCGICVGACPTATPFRRAGELSAGIELPDRTVADLREEVVAAAAKLQGPARILVFGCGHDPGSKALGDARTAVVSLPCVGMLPPSFLDFVLARHHADGVLLAGCAAHDCYERLGDQWVEQRIASERDPNLRARVPRERVAVAWQNPAQGRRLHESLAQFRAQLERLGPLQGLRSGSAAAERLTTAWRAVLRGLPRPLRWGGQAATYAALVGTDRLLRHAARLHQPAGGTRAAQAELQPRGTAAQAVPPLHARRADQHALQRAQRDQLRARPLARVRRVRPRRPAAASRAIRPGRTVERRTLLGLPAVRVAGRAPHGDRHGCATTARRAASTTRPPPTSTWRPGRTSWWTSGRPTAASSSIAPAPDGPREASRDAAAVAKQLQHRHRRGRP